MFFEKETESTPVTPGMSMILRHSFASIANDFGFIETTIAAMIAIGRVVFTDQS